MTWFGVTEATKGCGSASWRAARWMCLMRCGAGMWRAVIYDQPDDLAKLLRDSSITEANLPQKVGARVLLWCTAKCDWCVRCRR